MKSKTVILVGACLCVLGYSLLGQAPAVGRNEEYLLGEVPAADQNEKFLSAPGNLNDDKWPVSKVLAIYKAVTKRELIVASNVQDIHFALTSQRKR